jgi:D-alanyl-D-alanine carboxypeptidase
MTLAEQQRQFPPMVAKLIEFAYSSGYEITIGEAWRSAHEAEWDAQQGKGIGRSLHTIRLALDINLFKDGVYQIDSSAYEPLGVFWESIGGSWGGRFSKPDGNHFSIAFEGVR